MKGTLMRVANVIRAEVDDLLRSLEDPKKMVRQMLLDMEVALDEAVVAVGRAVANEKLLERRVKARQEEAKRWQQKAEEAVTAGEDELARKALAAKVVVEGALGDLEKALEEAREVSTHLKHQLTQLKTKLEDARVRQGALAVRRHMAEERRGSAGSSLNAGAFDRFDQFCQDIARDEVVAEVYEEMMGEKPSMDEFDKLEQKQRVEAALKELKAKNKPKGGTQS
ncbi:MAG: PspA/IM30 family protein [bacterium]|nr:PspA/IM30 family protein [bacterium]